MMGFFFEGSGASICLFSAPFREKGKILQSDLNYQPFGGRGKALLFFVEMAIVRG